MRIEIYNRQRRLALDLQELKRFAELGYSRCLADSISEGSDLESVEELEISIVSDRRIAALHRGFMGIRGATDVITFQHGEIILSGETAVRNAKRFHSSPLREIRLYIIHGMLHLGGYSDKEETGAQDMRRAQERILAEVERDL